MNPSEIISRQEDDIYPGWFALLACILHKDLTVSRSLMLMGITTENEVD